MCRSHSCYSFGGIENQGWHHYIQCMTPKHYIRKDNDGHKFKIPSDLVEEFDRLFESYCKAKRFSDEYYDLEAEFCNKFSDYMFG